MPTLLITGANRGIGLEFVRQYAADGWTVHATCREPGSATALREIGGHVTVHALDVGKPGEIAALARTLEGAPIDLLINNAGISGPREGRFGKMDYAGWEDAFRVNSIAPFRVTEAFLPNLAKGKLKRVISLTSRLGSIANNTDGGLYAYRSSKVALNAVMRSAALDLKDKGLIVVVFHPGWVKTDMGGPSAQVAPKDSIAGMRRLIDGLEPSDSGRFFNFDGSEVPW